MHLSHGEKSTLFAGQKTKASQTVGRASIPIASEERIASVHRADHDDKLAGAHRIHRRRSNPIYRRYELRIGEHKSGTTSTKHMRDGSNDRYFLIIQSSHHSEEKI